MLALTTKGGSRKNRPYASWNVCTIRGSRDTTLIPHLGWGGNGRHKCELRKMFAAQRKGVLLAQGAFFISATYA